MTVHHCPKCELRFSYKTELDDHCWHDHPEFRHVYPAVAPPAAPPPEPHPAVVDPPRRLRDSLVGWLTPTKRR